MKYVVVWDTDAANDVDTSWERATDVERERIVAALVSLQEMLASSGLGAGESREFVTERVAFVPPITVFFRIDRMKSLVRVFAAVVWRPR